MNYEDFLVAFFCLLFTLERTKETLSALHDVGGPLLNGWGEVCAVKANCVFESVGEHGLFLRGGRVHFVKISQNNREFDATRGYPGEDILSPPLHYSRDSSPLFPYV